MAKKTNGIEVTEVRFYEYKGKKGSKLLGYANITLNGEFAVTGIKVYDGKKGKFISMPSNKGKDDEYYDIAFPTTQGCREIIQNAILEEVEKED